MAFSRLASWSPVSIMRQWQSNDVFACFQYLAVILRINGQSLRFNRAWPNNFPFFVPQNPAEHQKRLWIPRDIEYVPSIVVKSKIDAHHEYPSNGYTISNWNVLRESGESMGWHGMAGLLCNAEFFPESLFSLAIKLHKNRRLQVHKVAIIWIEQLSMTTVECV